MSDPLFESDRRISIRRLTPADAAEFRRLRLIAVTESPAAYGKTHEEELARPLEAFAEFLTEDAENWVFGAYLGEILIGVIRLVRDTGSKECHKASIHGLYVLDAERGKGIASALIERAIETARGLGGIRRIRLSVTTNATALALYKKAGFVEYGIEEESLYLNGEYFPETHLVKKLG